MCADNVNVHYTIIIQDGLARELGKYDAHERRRYATTSHETHPGCLRKVSGRG